MNELAVGVDIGSSKICTILGEIDRNNQLQILGVGTSECKGLKKGVIIDIDNTAESIKSSVEQAERMSGMEIKSAFINLPGGQAMLIKNKGVIAVLSEDREITNSDVERALQAASIVSMPIDREIIGVIPLQFIVDGNENIKDPVGMIGVRLEAEAYIVAAPSAVVQNLIRSVERCNIDVTGIIITPLVSSEVLLTRDEKEMGVALVDVGGEITDISIFKNSTLMHTKLIPVGGVHITNDISIGLKIPFSESEILKRQYGCASVSMIKSVEDIAVNTGAGGKKKVTNEELTDIIEARVQEILYLIDKELEASGYKGSIPGGIVITGGGVAFIKGAVEAAYSIIGLPVRVGSPQFIGVASPIYSTGTGIVKYILSSRKYNITGNYTASDESAGVGKSGRKETDKVGKVIKKIKGFFTDFF